MSGFLFCCSHKNFRNKYSRSIVQREWWMTWLQVEKWKYFSFSNIFYSIERSLWLWTIYIHGLNSTEQQIFPIIGDRYPNRNAMNTKKKKTTTKKRRKKKLFKSRIQLIWANEMDYPKQWIICGFFFSFRLTSISWILPDYSLHSIASNFDGF